MAEVINMPRLSDTMEEGTVATWLKKVGDTVAEGDILAEIETDKATMEFESFYDGTLLYIGIQEGESAPVDQLLAIIGDEGEDISSLIDGKSSSEEETSETEDEEEEEEEEETKEDTSEEKEESEDSEEDTASAEIPEGVEVVNMPRLSDTMEEGTVATWLKKVGDKVEEGEILAEIETDKATMEFESFYTGTLLYIGIQEGETAKVDVLLAIIGPEGTDVSGIVSGASSDKPKTEKPAPPKEEKKTESKPEPVKKEVKQVAKVEKSSVDKEVSTDGRIFASPLAKKLAEEKGISLNQVQGSGDHGRIIRKDIENYQPSAGGSAIQAFVATGEESSEDIKHSQMRKTIAKRLGQSKFTAPHYYLNVEFDMEPAMAFRAQFNKLPETKISYNDIVVKATALALKKHAQVNSQWYDDRMQLNHHVHMGVAVAVPDGLVVPVVKFANEKSLQQINAEVKDLAGKARNKKLKPDEMDGSTFTISNLGMFGIKHFTSIINQPNSCILSVGAIIEKPVVKNGQIVVGHTMNLSMACDHRTVDGATGSEFLLTLKEYIENPVLMLA